MRKWCIVIVIIYTSVQMYSVVAQADSLRGQYTFNWLSNPEKTKCVIVDNRLLSLFSSSQFKCKAQTNTASGENQTEESAAIRGILRVCGSIAGFHLSNSLH
jgi:hypothetical protein